MTEHRRFNYRGGTRQQNPRPTIGLLIEAVSAIGNQYFTTIWAGIADAARERDVNLICFTGGSLGFSPIIEFDMERNVLFDLVDSANVDGLVISGGSLSNRVSVSEFQDFCDRYRSIQ